MSEQLDTLITADYAETEEARDAARIADEPMSGGLLTEVSGGDNLPAWLQAARAAAWQTFQQLEMPARTEQAWRFASLGKIDLSAYGAPQDVAPATREALIERSVGNAATAGRMIFANRTLLDCRSLPESLAAQGVIWKPLATAAADHEELFRRHFMAQEVTLGSRKFAALHQANVSAGAFIYVPKNVEVKLPLEAFYWLSGEGGSIFPHTLIVADEGSKVTVIDYLASEREDEAGFGCCVNDLVVGAGAKVTYLCAQSWGEKVASFQINGTTVGRDGHALSLHLNLGAAYARLESLSKLAGAGGRSDMLAATVASAQQEFDQRTLQDHLAPNTTSDLLYKNALSDRAKTIFAGLIRVQPDAQHTDAYQKVRNLMLSDDAEANSMPGLEILADEVRCTHGATSGHVDEEELFYLLARGIDRQTAQELIIHGFLNEVIDRLREPAAAERFRELLAEKFARSKQTKRSLMSS